MMDRMVRTAMLDVQAYEEVERDRDATIQALLIVVLVALASAIGGGLAAGVSGVILGALTSIIGWLLFAGVSYWVGTTFFAGPQTRTSMGELLRATGFAQSPGVLRILGFIPIIGIIISLIVSVWVLIAVVIGVRQALDFDTWRAVATSLIAWIIQVVLIIITFAIL